jgi:hypothetical protein
MTFLWLISVNKLVQLLKMTTRSTKSYTRSLKMSNANIQRIRFSVCSNICREARRMMTIKMLN